MFMVEQPLRRVNWDPKSFIHDEEPEVVPHQVSIPVIPTQAVVSNKIPLAVLVARPKITRNRTGNGHKSEMIRKLYDNERDYIRGAFLNQNGQIEEDDCTRIKPALGNEVAIFQVTGFISYLHRDVALGRTQVRDLPAYKEWMRTKYEGLWTQYNKPAFTSVRQRNARARSEGRPLENIPIQEIPIQPQFSTTPNFKALPIRHAYARTGT